MIFKLTKASLLFLIYLNEALGHGKYLHSVIEKKKRKKIGLAQIFASNKKTEYPFWPPLPANTNFSYTKFPKEPQSNPGYVVS